MGMRGVTLAQAGTFANNTYFDPFAYDAITDRALDNYLIFVAPGDESTRVGYYLRDWVKVSGENPGPGASFYWQADRVTQELSGNLISNGTFDSGVGGWTKNAWAASSFTADTHPGFGPSLRYDRNGVYRGVFDPTGVAAGAHTLTVRVPAFTVTVGVGLTVKVPEPEAEAHPLASVTTTL